jgi:hypothetical protein
MESASLPNRCQVSESTYLKMLPLNLFQFQTRGQVHIKGKVRAAAAVLLSVFAFQSDV